MGQADFTIVVKGRNGGAIELLNAVGVEAQAAGRKLAGLQEISAGLRRTALTLSAAGLALAGGLTYLTKVGGEFDDRLREVNTMVQATGRAYDALGASVLEIARDPLVAELPVGLSRGLYDVYSSGFAGKEGLEVLHTAAVLAAGGVAETSDAAADMVAVLNAYGERSGPAAQRVADELFKTVELGVMHFRDLNGQMGEMAALGSQLRIPFREIEAGLVVMTRRGFNVAESSTALARIMTTFLQPSKELTRALRTQGYESGMSAIKTLGLVGAMGLLQRITGDDQEQLAALIPEQRALRAALSLTSDQGRLHAEMLRELANSTGTAARAAKRATEGPMGQFRMALKDLNIEATELATKDLLPIAADLAKDLRSLVAEFRALPDETKRSLIQLGLWGTGALLASGAVAMLSSGVVNLIQLKGMLVPALRSVVEWLGRLRSGAAGAGTAAAETVAAVSGAAGGGSATGAAAEVALDLGAPGRASRRRPISRRRLADRMIQEGIESRAAALADRLVGGGRRRGGGIVLDAADLALGQAWRGGGRATATGSAALARRAVETERSFGRLAGEASKLRLAQMAQRSELVRGATQLKAFWQNAGGAAGLLGSLRGGLAGLPAAISGASTGLAAMGAQALAVVGPIALVAAAAVAAAYLVKRTVAMYEQMRAAQQQAKSNKQQELEAAGAASRRGVWTPEQVGRQMGYSERELAEIMQAGPGDARFDNLSKIARGRSHQASQAAARGRMEARNRAASEANLRAQETQAAGQYVPTVAGPSGGGRAGNTYVLNIGGIGVNVQNPKEIYAYLRRVIDREFPGTEFA